MGLPSFYRKLGVSQIALQIVLYFYKNRICLDRKGRRNQGNTLRFLMRIFNCFEKKAEENFQKLKSFYRHPVLKLPDFNILFEIECDADLVGIGAVLIQAGHPIAYFSKILAESRKKWTTYEQESYSVVKVCQQWAHYLFPIEYIINTEHINTLTHYILLTRKNEAMTIIHSSVTDFDELKRLYREDSDFEKVWT